MGALTETLRVRFGARIHDAHERLGEETVVIAREAALEIFSVLRDDARSAFDFLMDLTAVDYLGREPRFEVVAHLYSTGKNHRLRIKVPLPGDDPRMTTLSGLWKGANWLEREIWDMYGIRFEGHPDLRRILMYDEFEGYPLRKDYPYNKRQPLIPERDPIENPWPVRSFSGSKP